MAIERMTVMGVKWFNGEVEGKEYDTGTLFIQTPLDASKGNQKGFVCAEISIGDSASVKRIMHNQFPLLCDITLDHQAAKDARGKMSFKTVVTQCVPVGIDPIKKAA